MRKPKRRERSRRMLCREGIQTMWANSTGKTLKHLLTAVALPDGSRVLYERTCQRAFALLAAQKREAGSVTASRFRA